MAAASWASRPRASSKPLHAHARERLNHLVALLGLEPHPEGGRFRQIHRSTAIVQPGGRRPRRAAMTSIYYLLAEGEFGRWHRVESDEVWHLYEGGPLELLVAPPDLSAVDERRLDIASEATQPVSIVPAGWWQAARPLGDFALCGCTVAPGFEFDDFAFLSDEAQAVDRLTRLDARFRAWL